MIFEAFNFESQVLIVKKWFKLGFISITIIATFGFLYLYVPFNVFKTLVLVSCALILWGSSFITQGFASLTILALVVVYSGGNFGVAAVGLGQPIIFLLIASFMIAKSIEKVGLAERIARNLFLITKGNAKSTIFSIIMTMLLIGFMIPSNVGRVAVVLPFTVGLISVFSKTGNGESHFSKSIMISLSFVSSYISWGLITGSGAAIYYSSAMKELTNFQWTYSYWLLANYPIVILNSISLWLFLLILFPVKSKRLSHYRHLVEKNDVMSQEEKKTIAIICFMLIGWFTETVHGLPVAFVGLVGALLLSLPKYGVLAWKESINSVDWDTIFTFAASFSLSIVLQQSGTAKWIAEMIALINIQSIILKAFILMFIVVLFRLFFANTFGLIATLIPIVTQLASIWSVNPIWIGQLIFISSTLGFLFPFQSPTILMTYAYGHYSQSDLFKIGIHMTVTLIVLTLLASKVYWPIIDLSP